MEVLSDRELEVFELTGRGVATREIAEQAAPLRQDRRRATAPASRPSCAKHGFAEFMQHAVQWVTTME